MHRTKIAAEFAFGGHNPQAHPQNVASGYDVGKISAGCLVFIEFPFITVLYFMHVSVQQLRLRIIVN